MQNTRDIDNDELTNQLTTIQNIRVNKTIQGTAQTDISKQTHEMSEETISKYSEKTPKTKYMTNTCDIENEKLTNQLTTIQNMRVDKTR